MPKLHKPRSRPQQAFLRNDRQSPIVLCDRLVLRARYNVGGRFWVTSSEVLLFEFSGQVYCSGVMDAVGSKIGLGRNLRRSKRLGLAVPVQVYGQDSFRDPFREYARTISVSAHGGAVALAARVREGQTLLVVNTSTREEQECRVAHVGPVKNGKWTVGIEFAHSAESFWRVHFPPIIPGQAQHARCAPAYARPLLHKFPS
jgi:hypothetical protein